MKKIIGSLVFLLGIAIAGTIFAHGHDQDSTKMSTSDSLMQIEMAQHQQMEAVNAFPNYHPLVVHFPIVLLLMAGLFQLLSFFYFKKEFSIATLILLGLGVVTAWLASNTFHAMPGVISGKAKEIFDTHEQMATLTLWFSFTSFLLKISSHFFFKRKWWAEGAATLFLIASGITVSIAGHHGSMLVHMEGIGPMGKYLDSYKLTSTNPDSTVMDSTAMEHEEMSGHESMADHDMNGETEHHHDEAQKPEKEEDHHVGELGKGPHGGTIEEAEPFHMEIVVYGSDLIFYLLDGDAKPIDMKNVTGKAKMNYTNKETKTIELMEMSGKQTAMQAINGIPFTAICTLNKNGKSYTASFNSQTDLPKVK